MAVSLANFNRQKRDGLAIIPVYILLLLGIYTNLGLGFGGRYVAGLLTILGLGIFFVFSDMAVRVRALFVGVCALGFLVINVVATQKVGMAFSERVFSVGLLTVSVVGFSLVVQRLLKMSDVERAALHRLFNVICILIILGCILEVVGVLKPISDFVRAHIYGNAFIYESNDRDLRDFGIVRPKLFTQEPSHVAKMLGLAIFSNYALSPTRRNFLISLCFFLASMVALRSFSVFPSVLLMTILFCVHEAKAFRAAPTIAGGASLVTMLGVWNFTALFSLFPGGRAARIAAMRDSSAIERFIAPKQIFIYALDHYPIFGLGIGAKEYYLPVTVDIYSKFSFYNLYRYSAQADVSFGWYSALFEGAAALGIVGLVAFFIFALREVGWKSLPYFAICFLFVFLLDSGFPAPRTWIYFAFYLGVLCASLKGVFRQTSFGSASRRVQAGAN